MGQLVGKAHGEQVHPGHADLNIASVLFSEGVVQHLHVVRVSVLLALLSGEFPAAFTRINRLHRQVRALYYANLDSSASIGYALRCPFLQVLHSGEGVGQVSLQHDASFQLF